MSLREPTWPNPQPERRTSLLLAAGFGLLLAAFAGAQAKVRLLTSTELNRLWLTQRSPTLQNLASRMSFHALGGSAIAVRLPVVLGSALYFAIFWLMLRGRYQILPATAACLAILATPVIESASNASALTLHGTLTLFLCAGVAVAFIELLSRFANTRTQLAAVVLLFLCALGYQAECDRLLLHQRRAFFRLTDAIERAAAPGEAVVVDDPLLAAPLRWYASPALRSQIQSVAETISTTQESVLLSAPQSSFAQALAARGITVTEAPTHVPWDQLEVAAAHPIAKFLFALPSLAQPDTRIFFATPPTTKSGVSSQP